MAKRVANLEVEHFFQQLVTNGSLKVTKSGRVFNLLSGKELGKYRSDEKYRALSWGGRGNVKRIQVHRLVWGTFKGVPSDPTLVINHKNGKPGICALRNLELVTDSKNKLHAYNIGLTIAHPQHAEKNGLAVFTNAQVRRYRRLYRAGSVTQLSLSRQIGVSQSTISDMLRGKTYSSVTG